MPRKDGTFDWTPRVDELIRLRASGLRWPEIAEHFGTSERMARLAHRYWKEKRDAKHATELPPEFPDWKIPENVDWREWLGSWEDMLKLAERADPTQQILTVDLSHVKCPIALASASDLHMGGGYTSHAAIKDTIEFILAEKDMYTGLAGDSIEGFLPGLKSADTTEQMIAPVKLQLKALENLTEELTKAKKLWYMTWGDHDAKWFEKTVGHNIVKRLVDSKVPYFTGRGLVRLRVGTQEYFILLNHAERFSSQWADTHPQRRAYEKFFPADVVIAGHRHKPSFRMEHHYDQLREAGLNVGGKCWLVANGTFKVGPDPYTIRSWSKGILGVPTIIFRHDFHDVDVLESPVKAAAYLRGLRAA